MDFMARPLRVALPGAWYHVIARGIERRSIFRSEVYYQKFEELLATLPERFGVRLYTYVLMPNHYHLQVETPRLNLSEALRWLNVSYAVWFNRKTRRNGPLLQGRFKSVIHDPDEAGWIIHEYIHLNPLRVKRLGTDRSNLEGPDPKQRAEMLEKLNSFKWSSYRAYAGYVVVPEWLRTERVLAWVPAQGGGTTLNRYRERFREKIAGGDLRLDWKEKLAGDLIMGGQHFVGKVRKMLKGNRTEQKQLRALEKPPVDWAMIVSAIEKLWSEPWADVSQRHGDPGRELAMLIARRYAGMSLREIGEAVRGLQYPAVSDAIRRTSARLENDRGLGKKFNRLLKFLKLEMRPQKT
jgi:putative transposase